MEIFPMPDFQNEYLEFFAWLAVVFSPALIGFAKNYKDIRKLRSEMEAKFEQELDSVNDNWRNKIADLIDKYETKLVELRESYEIRIKSLEEKLEEVSVKYRELLVKFTEQEEI